MPCHSGRNAASSEWFLSPAAGIRADSPFISHSDLHPSNALKPAVDDYILKHNLVDPKEHRFVLLDEELGRAVGIKKPQVGERMAREEVLRKLRAGVTWSVSVGGLLK